MTRFAVIDIGTNSLKLLIADARAHGGFTIEAFDRATTRIGEGIPERGRVLKPNLDATLRALRRFGLAIDQHRCEHVFAFSTYALRKASNTRVVVDRIRGTTGIEVRILSGRDEASFAYTSARHHLTRAHDQVVLIDVGGGSTEYVHARGDRVATSKSVPLGALHLTSRYLHADPPSDEEFASMEKRIDAVVTRAMEGFHELRPPSAEVALVASGGSATTMSRMIGNRRGGGRVRYGDLKDLLARCRAAPLARRKRFAGLEPDRADIIIAGLAVVDAFMRSARKRVLTVNPGGVREGVALHVMQNNFRW